MKHIELKKGGSWRNYLFVW